jgi:hypothetical protein
MSEAVVGQYSVMAILGNMRSNVDRIREIILCAKELAPKSVDQYIRLEERMLRRERLRTIRLLENELGLCPDTIGRKHIRCILSDLRKVTLDRRCSVVDTLLFCARMIAIGQWGVEEQR